MYMRGMICIYVCIISSEESEETCLCDIQRTCPLANENGEKELYFLAKYMNRGTKSKSFSPMSIV